MPFYFSSIAHPTESRQAFVQEGISEAGFLENWYTLSETPDNTDESILVDAVKLATDVLKKIDTG
jgi:hypothetical protein